MTPLRLTGCPEQISPAQHEPNPVEPLDFDDMPDVRECPHPSWQEGVALQILVRFAIAMKNF